MCVYIHLITLLALVAHRYKIRLFTTYFTANIHKCRMIACIRYYGELFAQQTRALVGQGQAGDPRLIDRLPVSGV